MLTNLAEWYLRLMPAYPPKLWTNPVPLERATREYDSEVDATSPDAFLQHFPRLKLAGLDVLDLGCGSGGRTVRFKELGANSVTGLEIDRSMVEEARSFAESKSCAIQVLQGAAEALPFDDDSFDAVISYDVFEHVDDLFLALKECHRVLRAGGTLYAVFPPIHHPTGGSHFHGYVSRSPAPTSLFPRQTLIDAVRRIERSRGGGEEPLRPKHFLPGVNGTTVAKFERHLKTIPFKRTRIVLAPLRSNKLRYLNPVFAAASRLPLIREIATDRIQSELTK